MNSAGYDTATWAAVWEVMEQEEALIGARVPTFLRGHPSPAERKQRTRAHSAALEPRPSACTRAQPSTKRRSNHSETHGSTTRDRGSAEIGNALLERQREIGVPAGLVAFHEADMYPNVNPKPAPTGSRPPSKRRSQPQAALRKPFANTPSHSGRLEGPTTPGRRLKTISQPTRRRRPRNDPVLLEELR